MMFDGRDVYLVVSLYMLRGFMSMFTWDNDWWFYVAYQGRVCLHG